MRRHLGLDLGLLALITVALFGEALFSSRIVLSNQYGDLATQFLDWRAFGFRELAAGRLPLWNPHLFSGAPYFGGFQSGLLYPLNALFLFLPLNHAVDWTIAVHVFLAGAFTYAWAFRRGLQPAASVVAAIVFMCCSAHVMHIYAGHLSNLATLVWAPLVFLAIDGLIDAPSVRITLVGIFAAAMQVLAGHPQYVFYTAVAALVYGALNVRAAAHKGRFLIGLAAIALGGISLSAVQLFTGLSEAREMTRSAVSYEFASQFSLPPENLLTLIAPTLFGDQEHTAYWGRGYLWEMCVFVGTTGLVLAVLGAITGDRRARRGAALMTGVMVLLALGAHTPVFHWLFDWVPGFNQFRGTAKFGVLASLFLAMLAGVGGDALLKLQRVPAMLVAGVAAVALLALAGAFAVTMGADGWWRDAMLAVQHTGDSLLDARAYQDAAFVAGAANTASKGLAVAGGVLLVTAALFLTLGRFRWTRWAVLSLAVVELIVFARASAGAAEFPRPEIARIKDVLDTHPGDYRILNLVNPNAAIGIGAYDAWGYDPGVLTRYAQLAAAMQGLRPDQATQDVELTRDHPLLDLLRCRFVFFLRNGQFTVTERPRYLPRVLLVTKARVMDRHQGLAAITERTFDPRTEVLLESPPTPAPVASDDPGTARLIEADTDSLTIEADVRSPSILLVTDTYATGWRVRPLAGSPQREYQLMPGDYALRAIPLAAGHHLLRLEYVPAGFLIGRWISLMAACIFVAVLARLTWLRWSHHRALRLHRPLR